MSEHQLGRLDLSQDDSVAIIETDESEASDLSDHDARVVTTDQRRRRASHSRERTVPPDRTKNMSSSSASRRFRRTSAKPPTGTSAVPSASTASNTNLWAARQETSVDQSVNLMDASTLPYDPEAGASTRGARARPGMAMAKAQKSMVDVFLSDDRPQTRGGGSLGQSKYGLDAGGDGVSFKSKCLTFLMIAIAIVVIVLLFITLPPFGVFGGDEGNNNNNNNHSAQSNPGVGPPQEIFSEKLDTNFPTEAPTTTQAPTKAPKGVLISEEAEVPQVEENVDRPLPEPEVAEEEEEENLDLEDVPQASRLDAMKFFLMDQDVSEESQLEDNGSPSQLALDWITQKDSYELEIPGLESVATTNVVAEHALLQRYALAVFYYSMTAIAEAENAGRRNLAIQHQASEQELRKRAEFDATWLSDAPICQWQGVTCADDFESVIEVNLRGHLLQGTIPREFVVGSAMPFLKTLDLSKNQLEGTFPVVAPYKKGAGSETHVEPPASQLEVLNLSFNQLTGTMDNIMGLTNLKELHLTRNQFSGKIPDTIMDLSQMEDLRLSSNRFTGIVPGESLGELTGLKHLHFAGNKFSDELPMNLYTLTNLQELTFSSNSFHGQIPDTYGDLTNLRILHIDGNGIKGKIPSQLGQLTNLKEFQLDGNELTGEMPQEICDLRTGPLSTLVSDCADGEIACECCSECFRRKM